MHEKKSIYLCIICQLCIFPVPDVPRFLLWWFRELKSLLFYTCFYKEVTNFMTSHQCENIFVPFNSQKIFHWLDYSGLKFFLKCLKNTNFDYIMSSKFSQHTLCTYKCLGYYIVSFHMYYCLNFWLSFINYKQNIWRAKFTTIS